MKGKSFAVKTDEDRTAGNSLFKRGHYDAVVLAPGFVGRYPFDVLKGQDFQAFRATVLPKLDPDDPAILYGIELVYRRDPIKPSRGTEKWKAAEAFVAEILQDAQKLQASRQVRGFMHNSVTLAFAKGTTPLVLDKIRDLLAETPGVRLITAD
jgi:hypothetical protein